MTKPASGGEADTGKAKPDVCPPQEEKKEPEWLSSCDEEAVDRESADSFPASDPPSFTGVTRTGKPRKKAPPSH